MPAAQNHCCRALHGPALWLSPAGFTMGWSLPASVSLLPRGNQKSLCREILLSLKQNSACTRHSLHPFCITFPSQKQHRTNAWASGSPHPMSVSCCEQKTSRDEVTDTNEILGISWNRQGQSQPPALARQVGKTPSQLCVGKEDSGECRRSQELW